jgi:hypothetical protein
VSENIVLKRIFGYKREVKTGSWKKLHNLELTLDIHQIFLGCLNQGG